MNTMIYFIVLITSILVILLGPFAFIMALIRFGKQKGSNDLQVKKSATKQLGIWIICSIFLCIMGVGLLMVVLFYM